MRSVMSFFCQASFTCCSVRRGDRHMGTWNTHGKHLKRHQMIAARPVEEHVTLLALSWEPTVSSIEFLQLKVDVVVSPQPAEAPHCRLRGRSSEKRSAGQATAVTCSYIEPAGGAVSTPRVVFFFHRHNSTCEILNQFLISIKKKPL